MALLLVVEDKEVGLLTFEYMEMVNMKVKYQDFF